jgi:hypothetical protein
MICEDCEGGFKHVGWVDGMMHDRHVMVDLVELCPDCIGASHGPRSFKCPTCGAVSYNDHDIRERYCGRCHAWQS